MTIRLTRFERVRNDKGLGWRSLSIVEKLLRDYASMVWPYHAKVAQYCCERGPPTKQWIRTDHETDARKGSAHELITIVQLVSLA